MLKENILYKIRQHKLLFWLKVSRGIGLIIIVGTIAAYLFGLIFLVISLVTAILYIQIYYSLFWFNSYFYITNKKIGLKIRNGIFSKFEMSLYFTQIKDMAYSKNNLAHFYFNFGTFFARSSGAEDDSGFMVKYMPDIENVYLIVSTLYSLPVEKRDKIENLEDLEGKPKKDKHDTIEKNRKILLDIEGIKEVYELTKEDRKFIFENEEDRNHGVYECIKREVVFCATHDDTFRDPDAAIVFKVGNKIIFPAISFHEVDEKNTVSSSPGIEVHNYLVKKLKNFHKDDATLLIGFDIN